ncbi:MAG TPA: site-2 protease family protein [Frankiaceae bacterium]|nr:site-2 protease family protein [Frankiaceae bacterium]
MTADSPQPRVSPGRGLRVLTVRGVPVYMSPFAPIFALLVAQSAVNVAERRLPDLAQARVYGLVAAVAVGFLASLVLHELGHALVAQRLKFDVHSVTIFGFAGFTEYRPEARTPRSAFLVSVTGPVVNLVLGGAATAAYAVVQPNTVFGVVLFELAFINLALGVFNLAPGLPLDGGHVLQAGVWGVTGNRVRATKVAAYVGFVVAVLLGLWALSLQTFGASLITLMFAVWLGTGAFASLRAQEVRAKLPGLSAGALARPALPVDANVPLAEALRRAQQAGATAVVAVDSRGEPIALMNGGAADATPPERRPWVTLASVSRPLTPELRVSTATGGEDLLTLLQENPASEYLVIGDDGRPAGVLASVDLVARLDPSAAQKMAARR